MSHGPVAPGLLLVGTDTGVGKTTLARGLLHLARQSDLTAVPFKPAETGCDDGPPRDALQLLAAAAIPNLTVTDICPYAFAAALAPSVAARLAGCAIDLDRLVRCGQDLARRGDLLLVEGAGGILSPYGAGFGITAIAAPLELDVVIVAANRLGTINHTALALREVHRQALNFRGVVLVDVAPGHTLDQESNAIEIANVTGTTPLGVLPHLPDASDLRTIARQIRAHIDLRPIFGGRLASTSTDRSPPLPGSRS